MSPQKRFELKCEGQQLSNLRCNSAPVQSHINTHILKTHTRTQSISTDMMEECNNTFRKIRWWQQLSRSSALPGGIVLQRSQPNINKGDLAVHCSRIKSLCMKPLEIHLSLACKMLSLQANPWLNPPNTFSWLYEGKPGLGCEARCQPRRRT